MLCVSNRLAQTHTQPLRRHGVPPVALRMQVLERAASSAAAHGLRAYGAVQLSCALAARAADPQVDGFLRFDGELRGGGEEGFVLVA